MLALIIIFGLVTVGFWVLTRHTNLSNKIRSTVVVVTGISIAVGGIFITGQTQDVTSVDIIEEAIVRTDNIAITLNAPGTLVPRSEVDLSFQTSGKVTEIMVEEGQFVSAGDIIAILDAESLTHAYEDAELRLASERTQFEALFASPSEEEIALAEAEYLAAQLAYGSSTAISGEGSIDEQIEALEVELAKNRAWQSALQRDVSLANLSTSAVNLEDTIDRLEGETTTDYYNAVNNRDRSATQLMQSEATLQQQTNAIFNAEADYVAESNRITDYGGSNSIVQEAQAEIDLINLRSDPDDIELTYAQIDLALAQIALAEAEAQLEDAIIRAPFDGLIVSNNLTIGEFPPNDAVTLVDLTAFEINLPIDEVDIINIDLGQTVSFSLDALPDVELVGTVEQVAVSPDIADELVTYDVLVVVDNTDERIRSGMSTTALVTLEEYQDIAVIPNRFITTVDQMGISFVQTLDSDGNLVRQPVTIGVQTNTVSQILSGIEVGDSVVIVPNNAIGGGIANGLLGGGA